MSRRGITKKEKAKERRYSIWKENFTNHPWIKKYVEYVADLLNISELMQLLFGY